MRNALLPLLTLILACVLCAHGAPPLDVRATGIACTDIVYSERTDLLYGIRPANERDVQGYLQVIDPYEATVVRTLPLRESPRALAITADGTHLFVGMVRSIQRVRLNPMEAEDAFPLACPQDFHPFELAGLATVPDTQDAVVAVVTGSRGDNGTSMTALYRQGRRLPQVVYGYATGVVFAGDARECHTYGESTTLDPPRLRTLTVLDDGLREAQVRTGALKRLSPGERLITDGVRLFSATSGGVLDAATFERAYVLPTSTIVCTDPHHPRIYRLGLTSGHPAHRLTACDSRTGIPIDEQAADLSGFPTRMLRWGGDGIALVTNNALTLARPQVVPALRVRVGTESIPEAGAGVHTARVTLPWPAPTDTVIHLSSSDPRVTVPPAVTIRAGATETIAMLAVHDDGVVNARERVDLIGQAEGWARARTVLILVDDEAARLTLTLPTRVRSGSGLLRGAGRITLNRPSPVPLTITLTAHGTAGQRVVPTTPHAMAGSRAVALALPASITVPAGADAVAFDITVPDEDVSNAPRFWQPRITDDIMATASAPGWTAGRALVAVTPSTTLEIVDHIAGLAGVAADDRRDAIYAAGFAGVMRVDLLDEMRPPSMLYQCQQAGVLAISGDNAFLYAGLAGGVVRIPLDGGDPVLYRAPTPAVPATARPKEIVPVPGSPTSIVVVWDSGHVTVLDDSGAMRGTPVMPDTTGAGLVFDGDRTLYGTMGVPGGYLLRAWRLDEAGLTHLWSEAQPITPARTDAGPGPWVFGPLGNIIDPAGRRVVAWVPGAVKAVDQTLKRVYAVAGTGIRVFDVSTGVPSEIGTVQVRELHAPVATLVRFGRDGLAVATGGDGRSLVLIRAPRIAASDAGVDLMARAVGEYEYAGTAIRCEGRHRYQIAGACGALGQAADFDLLVCNDGKDTDAFTLTCPIQEHWRATWRTAAGTDITAAVTGDGWRTPELAPGEAMAVCVSLLPLEPSNVGGRSPYVSQSSFLVSAASRIDPCVIDQFTLRVSRLMYAAMDMRFGNQFVADGPARLTARAVGADLEYRFEAKPRDETRWMLVSDWSTDDTCSAWRPMVGEYDVRAIVRERGSGAAGEVVTPPARMAVVAPAPQLTLTGTPAGVVRPGTRVRLTVTPPTGTDLEYYFYCEHHAGTVTLLENRGATADWIAEDHQGTRTITVVAYMRTTKAVVGKASIDYEVRGKGR